MNGACSNDEAGDVGLRLAVPDDAPTIHALICVLASDTGAPARVTASADDLRKAMARVPPDFEVLLAERGGRAVGLCLYFGSFSSWRGERGVYVQDIWVDAAERGRGLARRLIAETARRATRRDARYLRLAVDRGNASARRFYARLGLKHAERDRIYMATGDAFAALRQADRTSAD